MFFIKYTYVSIMKVNVSKIFASVSTSKMQDIVYGMIKLFKLLKKNLFINNKFA